MEGRHGAARSVALDDRGQIVGESLDGDGPNGTEAHPVKWHNGGIVDLSPRDSSGAYDIEDGAALSINNADQIVGYVWTASRDLRRAYIWENGTGTDLGTLDDVDISLQSSASDINDRGQIVGWSGRAADRSGNHPHAVLWTHR